MYYLAIFINYLTQLFIVLIIIRVLLSWFRGSINSKFARFIMESTEPILKPIRNMLPRTGMIDLSPIVAVIALDLGRQLLLYFLSTI